MLCRIRSTYKERAEEIRNNFPPSKQLVALTGNTSAPLFSSIFLGPSCRCFLKFANKIWCVYWGPKSHTIRYELLLYLFSPVYSLGLFARMGNAATSFALQEQSIQGDSTLAMAGLVTSSNWLIRNSLVQTVNNPVIDFSLIVFGGMRIRRMRTTSHPVHLPPLQHLPSLPSLLLIYPLPFPPLLQSPPQTPPKTRKLLEAINRNTEFLWPNEIGLLELQGPYRLLQYPFVPNNNDFDEILNGPRGEIAPSTRPPNTSPK